MQPYLNFLPTFSCQSLLKNVNNLKLELLNLNLIFTTWSCLSVNKTYYTQLEKNATKQTDQIYIRSLFKVVIIGNGFSTGDSSKHSNFTLDDMEFRRKSMLKDLNQIYTIDSVLPSIISCSSYKMGNNFWAIQYSTMTDS